MLRKYKQKTLSSPPLPIGERIKVRGILINRRRKMNPWPRYEESIIFHAYQKLGRKKVITLKKHLSRCGRCRTYLNELNRVFRIIETYPEFSSNLSFDIEW